MTKHPLQLTPESSRIANKTGKISLTEYDRTYKLVFSNKILKHQYTDGGLNEDDHLEDNTDCSSSGEVKLFSLLRVELEVDQKQNQFLPRED